ncbi:MAG: hypothetical protein ABR536_01675 [Solirubrobacterales bacterium]
MEGAAMKVRSCLAIAALALCVVAWAGCSDPDSDPNDNNSGGTTSVPAASTTDNLGSTPNAQSGSGNSAPQGPVQSP